ncbi:MAG TPA: hypothetical protein VFE25_06950 [Opitutaceae bacterium]|jgi:hypothetical protein|nr:hypothetical protein [Opitutaceae bacterium]
MKSPILVTLLGLCLLAAPAARSAAQGAPVAAEPRVLTIVVSETLDRRAEGVTTYAAIEKAFTRVFSRQGWPVKVEVTRFASNNPDYDLELDVFFKSFNFETPDDLTVRAWVTLYDRGAKHDFGMLKYQLNQRPLDKHQDGFEAVLRGEAQLAAAKVGPVLFPAAGH